MTNLDTILFWVGLVLNFLSILPIFLFSPRSFNSISPQALGFAVTAYVGSMAAHSLWG